MEVFAGSPWFVARTLGVPYSYAASADAVDQAAETQIPATQPFREGAGMVPAVALFELEGDVVAYGVLARVGGVAEQGRDAEHLFDAFEGGVVVIGGR